MIKPSEVRKAAALVAKFRREQRKSRPKIQPIAKEQRQVRERDPGFLAYLRRQPCRIGVGCDGPVQAAHLRFSDARHGRVNPGMQRKPSDRWASSLCAFHHAAQHAAGNERAWWESHGLDGSQVALEQFAAYQKGTSL